MIVDGHHHLWRPDQGYTWLDDAALAAIRRPFGPDELRPVLAESDVDRTVLVEGGRCDLDEATILFGHARATPQIAGVVAWADLDDPDLAAVLAGYRELPGGELLVGIRSQVQAQTDPAYLDRPSVRRALRIVAADGLAFDLVIRADQLAAAARVALAVPELRFVLDHLGKPRIRKDTGLAEWLGPFAMLAAQPNVTAKLSGLVTEADWTTWTIEDLRPFVVAAVEHFGPRRLMFGSDWPVCLLAASYAQVKEALTVALPPLTSPERAAIFGGTAARTYRLKER